MSQLFLDQLFDLDMALTMVDSSSHACAAIKISDSDTMSSITNQIELPTVNASGVCMVCMEGFQSSASGKQVPCGHIFHSTCIARWLTLHDSCPLCRSSVKGHQQSSSATSV